MCITVYGDKRRPANKTSHMWKEKGNCKTLTYRHTIVLLGESTFSHLLENNGRSIFICGLLRANLLLLLLLLLYFLRNFIVYARIIFRTSVVLIEFCTLHNPFRTPLNEKSEFHSLTRPSMYKQI